MVEIINILALVATIGVGLISWIAPRYTLAALDLRTGDSEIGLSELRGASGAVFSVVAIAALVLGDPLGYVMVGVVYLGAGLGRLTSIVLDGTGTAQIWVFFAWEAIFAAWLILANM